MTLALTDLDRDELLALIERSFMLLDQRNITLARIDVASARHKAASEALVASSDKTSAAVKAWQAAKGTRGEGRAWTLYLAQREADKKLQAASDRLWRKLEKLWAESDAEHARSKGAA